MHALSFRLSEALGRLRTPVISSSVEKSNRKARSTCTPFCPSLTLRDFSTSLVAPNCALSKPRLRGLQLHSVAAPLSRKSHGFARVLGRKLRFGRNDKRGEKADDKSGKTQSVDLHALSFRLSRGGQSPPRRTEKSDDIVRSTLKRRREKRVP